MTMEPRDVRDRSKTAPRHGAQLQSSVVPCAATEFEAGGIAIPVDPELLDCALLVNAAACAFEFEEEKDELTV